MVMYRSSTCKAHSCLCKGLLHDKRKLSVITNKALFHIISRLFIYNFSLYYSQSSNIMRRNSDEFYDQSCGWYCYLFEPFMLP